LFKSIHLSYGTKPCTYLACWLKLSPNELKWASIWPTKPCTYLALRLTASPNRPKWASTWPTSPWSSIKCAQNDFQAYWTFCANHAIILRWDEHYLQMDRKELLLDPHHVGVQSGASKLISKPMVRLALTVFISFVEINRTSKWTETSFHLTHIT
jgi:hypothetical protein